VDPGKNKSNSLTTEAMTLKSIPPRVLTPAPLARIEIVPELLWPSVSYSGSPAGYREQDRTEFPEEAFIRQRYQLITGNRCEFSLEVLRHQMYSATMRILILDRFFAEYGYPFLEDVMGLTNASDIRVVSKMANRAGQNATGQGSSPRWTYCATPNHETAGFQATLSGRRALRMPPFLTCMTGL
jgi:hypothetical protein